MDNIEELIDRYLSKSMTAIEVKDFENLLKTDTTLHAEYVKSIAARKFIEEAGRLELREKFDVFESEELTGEKAIIPLWFKRTMATAAVFIVLFGLYQVVFNSTISSDAVFESYFETYKAPSVERNSETTLDTNLQSAMKAYEAKSYEEALQFFDKLEDKTNYVANFYKGLSYLSSKDPNYKQALQSFEIVLQTDNDYNQQALWYNGLTLLKLKETDKALKVFQKIKETTSYNHEKAVEIVAKNIEN